jgi:Ring finger domain
MYLHSWEDWFHFSTGFLALITFSAGLILSSPSHIPILFWFSVFAPLLVPLCMYVLLFAVIGALYVMGKALQWWENSKVRLHTFPAELRDAHDLSDGFHYKSIFYSVLTYLYEKKPKDEDCACPICKEEVQQGDVMTLLPICVHSFHKACIVPWLMTSMTCPICRCRVEQEIPREVVFFSEY